MKTIEIDMDVYIELLCERKSYVESRFGWTKLERFPSLWEFYLNMIRQCGVSSKNASPSFLIDNLIVNGDYGSFDEYRRRGESNRGLADRLEKCALFVDRKNKCVLISC